MHAGGQRVHRPFAQRLKPPGVIAVCMKGPHLKNGRVARVLKEFGLELGGGEQT